MTNTSRELIRELRWLTYSGAALALAVTAAGVAVAGVLAGIASTRTALAAFAETLARFRENGEDIAAALAAPATVEGDAAHQVISNSLRFDLDQAVLALTQLEPVGAVCSVLSLCALLVFPILGFVLGVFLSTHDVGSGSVIVRWPQSGILPFAVSKPVVLAASLAALVVLVSVLTVPAAWIAQASIAADTAELTVFAVDAPPVARAVGIGALAVLTGTTFGALGMLVGSVTRNRTFTTGIFAVAFLLLPLVGGGDPRNFITLAGEGTLYFAGQFRPVPIGDLPPAVAAAVLAGSAVALVALSLIPWLTRSRTERGA